MNRLMILPGSANLLIGVFHHTNWEMDEPALPLTNQVSRASQTALFWFRQEISHDASRFPSVLGQFSVVHSFSAFSRVFPRRD
jgi:hypothetical protein